MNVKLGENPRVEFVRFTRYADKDGNEVWQHAQNTKEYPILSEGVTDILHRITIGRKNFFDKGGLILHSDGHGMIFFQADLNGSRDNELIHIGLPIPEGYT
jgi:hypothetical protein